MGFAFPLFLVAGLAILIPVIVHLVNLRRYKREFFPNVRFLKRLSVSSKKASELRKRWLLLFRLLFLLALVLAFAQPYWKWEANTGKSVSNVAVIYIDNSLSMSVQQKGIPLLALAKNQALDLVRSSPADARFVIMTNERLYYSDALDKTQAVKAIHQISLNPGAVTLEDVRNSLEVAPLPNKEKVTPVYIFSDFQATTLKSDAFSKSDTLKHLKYYLFPLQAKDVTNKYFDSAIVLSPEMTGSSGDKLVVTLGRLHFDDSSSIHLRVLLNGETQLVKTMIFRPGNLHVTDTLPISIRSNEVEKIEMILRDGAISFDDTFRLAIKKPSGYAAMVISKSGQLNPYIQAAFNSMPDVRVQVFEPRQISYPNIQPYSLVIVQDGDDCNQAVDSLLKQALASGKNVLFFPGDDVKQQASNSCLKSLADIQFGSLDTVRQQVVQLQQNHPLLSGIFESIPDQVQLPVADRHFPLVAALSANEQDVMSFSNGNPLLASFDFNDGTFYLSSVSLSGENSNFPLSYFFAPILYKMTVPAGVLQQFETYPGSKNPVWIPNGVRSGYREIWMLLAGRAESIPPQKNGGQGLAVFLGSVVNQTGFYKLKPESGQTDSLWVAVNVNPLESILNPAKKVEIEKLFAPQQTVWLDAQKTRDEGWMPSPVGFPLWKLALLLAMVSLLGETLLLVIRPRKVKESKPALL